MARILEIASFVLGVLAGFLDQYDIAAASMASACYWKIHADERARSPRPTRAEQRP